MTPNHTHHALHPVFGAVAMTKLEFLRLQYRKALYRLNHAAKGTKRGHLKTLQTITLKILQEEVNERRKQHSIALHQQGDQADGLQGRMERGF